MTETVPRPISSKLMALLLSASLTPLTSRVLTAQIRTTVAQILSSPARFNQQTVSVAGKVERLKHKDSKGGKKYTTFSLKDLEGRGTVRVFSWGDLGIQEGQTVTVTGIFNQTKKVQEYIFKNEIEAQIVQ